jgi:hypothetical protein
MERVTRIYPATVPTYRREDGVIETLFSIADGTSPMPGRIAMTPQIHTLLGWSLTRSAVKVRLMPLVGREIPIMVSDDVPEPGWEVTW